MAFQAKLEDSNVALLGSDEDKRVKHEDAMTAPEWQEAGKVAGVQVWRIVDLQVVPWVDDNGEHMYGPKWIRLYEGDSYIILESVASEKQTDLEYHVYFWLGTNSSQDEYTIAAYKTVELDAFFDGKCSQSREVMAKESEAFRKIFPKISYLQGGARSGFHHSVKSMDAFEAKLYHVRKTKQGVVEKHVFLTLDSLNQGDCFVLDAGRLIYIWHGTEASPLEKYEANVLAENLEHQRNGEGTATHDLDAVDGKAVKSQNFWQHIGVEDATDKVQEVQVLDGLLYKLVYDPEKEKPIAMCEVGRKDLHKTMLDSNHVMLLDHGNEFFVWIGGSAPEEEKKDAFNAAHTCLEVNGRDLHTPIHIFKEGKDIKHKLWVQIFSK